MRSQPAPRPVVEERHTAAVVSTNGQPRKDVERNRARLLRSADALIREHGMDLSLNAVAHHAGLGVGTAYRHFADRDALLRAMFDQRLEQVRDVMIAHGDDEDPVAGLRATILEVCELQSADRGLWDVVSTSTNDVERESVQSRLFPLADRLAMRAIATGRMRAGFATEDIPVLFWTGGALGEYFASASPSTWRRYVELLLDGLIAHDVADRPAPTEPAPTPEQISTAMDGWRARRTRQA